MATSLPLEIEYDFTQLKFMNYVIWKIGLQCVHVWLRSFSRCNYVILLTTLELKNIEKGQVNSFLLLVKWISLMADNSFSKELKHAAFCCFDLTYFGTKIWKKRKRGKVRACLQYRSHVMQHCILSSTCNSHALHAFCTQIMHSKHSNGCNKITCKRLQNAFKIAHNLSTGTHYM